MHDHENHEPRRLSALYQYHNAPEVAPAHGLEYDDTNYPVSDKYPVITTTTPYKGAEYTGKHAFVDNRPPRIIFGMKIKTFLAVAAVMILIVIGAAVGGAVGGKSMRESAPAGAPFAGAQNSTTSEPPPSPSPTTASHYTAPTPTYTPLSDCPASNNTLYSSSYSFSNLTFTKYCDVASPLLLKGASTLAEAFVYTFSDCVELCAGLKDSVCEIAVYQSKADRPANCYVGTTSNDTFSMDALEAQDGSAVALLEPS